MKKQIGKILSKLLMFNIVYFFIIARGNENLENISAIIGLILLALMSVNFIYLQFQYKIERDREKDNQKI